MYRSCCKPTTFSRCPTQTPQDPHSAGRSQQLRETESRSRALRCQAHARRSVWLWRGCPPHSPTAAPRQLVTRRNPAGEAKHRVLPASSQTWDLRACGAHTVASLRGRANAGALEPPASGETVQALWENEEWPGEGSHASCFGAPAPKPEPASGTTLVVMFVAVRIQQRGCLGPKCRINRTALGG